MPASGVAGAAEPASCRDLREPPLDRVLNVRVVGAGDVAWALQQLHPHGHALSLPFQPPPPLLLAAGRNDRVVGLALATLLHLVVVCDARVVGLADVARLHPIVVCDARVVGLALLRVLLVWFVGVDGLFSFPGSLAAFRSSLSLRNVMGGLSALYCLRRLFCYCA